MNLHCVYCLKVIEEDQFEHHWEYDCLQIPDEDHENLIKRSDDAD